MAPGLGLAHTDPTSYHPSKAVNGTGCHNVQTAKETLPKVPVLSNTASVEEVVEAMKVRFLEPSPPAGCLIELQVAGGCVIKNAVEHQHLDQIESKDLFPLPARLAVLKAQ